MSHTAKIDPASSDAIDDDVLTEMENIEATGVLEYKPDPKFLAYSEALDDASLEDYEDADTEDVLEDELSFVLGED